MLLNGRRLNLRGASIHEDDLEEGGALSQGTRRAAGRPAASDLGATVTRSHYPLHPAFIEAFDRRGILYWVQAPVYQLPNTYFDQARRAARPPRARVRLTVRNNLNHPSIFTWSLANEPAGNRSRARRDRPRPATLHPRGRRGRARARRHAPHRDRPPVAARRAAHEPGLPLPRRARRERVLRLVPLGTAATCRARRPRWPSSARTSTSCTRPTRDLPLVITEFGAEAARPRAGGAAGQLRVPAKFVLDHLAVHASKPYMQRLDPLGAARLPRRPHLAGRRPAGRGPRRRGTTRA